jgi:hypothetical protein
MKNRILSFALYLPLLAISLTSCKEENISFDSVHIKTVDINITQSTNPDGSASFSSTDTLKLEDGQMLDISLGSLPDLLERLVKVEVASVYVEVLSAEAPAIATFNGTINFNEYSMTFPTYNVLQMLSESHQLQLTDNGNFLIQMVDKLLSDKMFVYTVNGNVSEVPVNAQLRFTFKLKLTAEKK